jgi:hypothetical protein
VAEDSCIAAVSRYAERLHAIAGPGHHVVSPLGAWMLVALCATLNVDHDDTDTDTTFAEVLGADPVEAAKWAAGLLAEPHPLVAAGAGLWVRHAFESPALRRWRDGLPDEVTTGDIPTQGALDAWADEHTYGLIERFPIAVTPEIVCILATALATKVSWEQPFTVVEAAALAPSPWAGRLERVLRAPRGDPRHRQFLTATDRAGLVAVHLARARGGLLVGSVIAADGSVPAGDVLAATEDIVTAEAREPGRVARHSLFDLPLGDGTVWSISEEEVETKSPDGREEVFVSVLPAWSAETTVDLNDESLGVPAAARALRRALGLAGWSYEAKQAAVARYSAEGFEAAAVTGLAIATSRPAMRPGHRREANVRFGHPFAVVAAACNERLAARHGQVPGLWQGLPVFAAWISEPSEAEPPPGSGARVGG